MQHDPSPQASATALGELCARYWYPVYAHVRCSGYAPALAQDIARSFFGELLRDPFVQRSTPPQRFRDFLLDRLRGFLTGDWRDLREVAFTLPAPAVDELETRYRTDIDPACDPVQAYQRGFACEVIARALDRLREEARQTGHADMYAALSPYFTVEPSPDDYAAMAQSLGQRPLALIVALKRLRQRFRELAGRELSDTVESAADLADEQRTLHGFLSPRR